MKSLNSRLATLEQRKTDAQRILGIRWFNESHDTAGIFYEIANTAFYQGEQGYIQSDLDALSAQGWSLIKVIYHSPEITEA